MLALQERPAVAVDSDGAWLVFDELHHRVGNEFMAVIAALHIARCGAHNAPEAIDHLDEAVLRLEGFCRVHKTLDRTRMHRSACQRLEDLCQAMSQSKAAALGIHIALSAREVVVDDETAWTLSVVASELVTNALKHAFRADGQRVVGVDLREEAGSVILTVADNGVGVATSRARSIAASSGFGWSVVEDLADRVGGTIHRRSGQPGTTVTLRVPLRRRAQ
jgi:two-component sensor histidine kinase